MLPLIVVIGAVQSVIAIVGLAHHSLLMYSGTVMRAAGSFLSPNSLYTLMLFCLIPGIVAVLSARSAASLLPLAMACSTMFAALLLTWSRGGALAIGVAAVWIAARIGGRRHAAAAAIASLMLVLITFHVRTHDQTSMASTQRSNASRLSSLRSGIAMVARHWELGYGTGALADPVPVVTDGVVSGSVALNPRNMPLLFLEENGVLGELVALAACVLVLRALYLRRGEMATSLGAIWCAAVTSGLFDTPFLVKSRPDGNVLLGLLLGATLLYLSTSEVSGRVVGTEGGDACRELD
ncbi:MAG: O-antigen ligase family protein [Patescibacteria group bacterium]|nr:O-antigen ligase family protein [Patescibacteria group bacterium]